mgnify:FL=1
MKKDFTFNANDVTCNGIIAGCSTILTSESHAHLKTFLDTHFMMTDKNELLQELEDSNLIDGRWIVGSRASDTDQIIDRMVSGMYNYAILKFKGNYGSNLLAEMWINAQVNLMTAQDIIIIMEKALIDCASADHWYTYEKQW